MLDYLACPFRCAFLCQTISCQWSEVFGAKWVIPRNETLFIFPFVENLNIADDKVGMPEKEKNYNP